MKELRKNKDNLLVCEECQRIFPVKSSLCQHISKYHNTQRYYDKWILNNKEDRCQECGNKNIFISIGKGYKNGCSRSHIVKINHDKIQKSIMEKYGVRSALCINGNRKRGMLKKYGVEYPGQSKIIKNKMKQTNLERYGVENPFQSEIFKKKIKQTNLKKYGVEYPTQSIKIRDKIKESFRKSYNCEYALQNIIFFNKQQKSAYYARKYKNTSIYYRSSFEFDFLNKYISKFKIKNGPTIRYILNNNNKIYYPDFYISSLNLIIEIKNSYLAKKDKLILETKQEAVLIEGFYYIMIIDKDYKEFNNLFL